MTTHDTAFQFAAANIRFGSGITGEVGDDLNDLGVRRTLVVIDPAVRDTATGETVLASLKAARVDFDVYDQVVVEPTDASFRSGHGAARTGQFDSFVAVGGGSTIDTAKAANLYSTHAAIFRLRQCANRPRAADPEPAQAAHRHPHDGRHRQRNDGRGDF